MKPGTIGLGTNSAELQEMQNPEQLRKMSVDGNHPGLRQRLWGLEARMDPTVTFEEYTFWAKIEREMEVIEQRKYNETVKHMGVMGGLKSYFTKVVVPKNNTDETHGPPSGSLEKQHSDSDKEGVISPIPPSSTHDFDAEWRQAARALRTSGWVTIFYLITTDILGWGQTAYVYASAGYSTAIGVFVLFGVAAMCSALFIWRTFLGLDSSRFPVLSFGDPFFRLFGPKTRKFINITQAFQMFCTVAVIVQGNSQLISQLNNAQMCYIVTGIITVIIGVASCTLRSLKHIGFLANFAVWINIVSFVIILVVAPKYGPDPTYALQTTLLKTFEPVKTFGVHHQQSINNKAQTCSLPLSMVLIQSSTPTRELFSLLLSSQK